MKKIDNDIVKFVISMSLIITVIFMGFAYCIMTPSNYDYFIYAGISSFAISVGMVLRVLTSNPIVLQNENILKEKKTN